MNSIYFQVFKKWCFYEKLDGETCVPSFLKNALSVSKLFLRIIFFWAFLQIIRNVFAKEPNINYLKVYFVDADVRKLLRLPILKSCCCFMSVYISCKYLTYEDIFFRLSSVSLDLSKLSTFFVLFCLSKS